MKNKLYSLLIGITDYPTPNELDYCEEDVKEMRKYLTDLKTTAYAVQKPLTLTNGQASKTGIIKAIEKIVEKLKDGDTFLLYFSGHGTQEISKDRFREDHNGVLEALVCHYKEEDTNYLLADKELRYLLNQCKSKAHIVGVFDCCHSGDVMRDYTTEKKQMRRISFKQPERDYDDFLFSNKINEKTFETKWFKDVFANANIVTISACQSQESSWEKDGAGVFTRNMLKVLDNNNSVLNYNDLVKQVEIAIRSTTREKQTPTISVQGDRQYNQLTSWLKLNGDQLTTGAGFIQYNKKNGWIYSKGELTGVKEGDEIEIRVKPQKEEKLIIEKVNLSDSIVSKLPSGVKLKEEQTYAVISSENRTRPQIFIEDLDNEPQYVVLLESIVEDNELANLEKVRENADFQINIFNQCIYFSFPNDAFRPLNQQLNLQSKTNAKKTKEKLAERITKDINIGIEIIDNWFYLKNLEKNDDFPKIPIKIEFKFIDSDNWIDITNGNDLISPFKEGSSWISKALDIRVTNTFNEAIYVTPLALLNARLGIHSDKKTIFNGESEYLKPNKSITFPKNYFWLDKFQEVYNWQESKVFLKFIVSTKTNLATEISKMVQDGFNEPLLIGGVKRGFGRPSDDLKREEKWGVYSSELVLPNPTFNQITGDLSINREAYQKHEVIAPFIEHLYLENNPSSFSIIQPKPNNNKDEEKDKDEDEEKDKEKGFISDIKMWAGNNYDHHRRKRKFKVLKEKFPNKGIVLAEGDSWFLYPVFVKDTIDYIMEEWPVRSLAWAGDTLANYEKTGQLKKYAKKLKPKYILMSGGGNDVVGPGITALLKDNINSVANPIDYISDAYGPKMTEIRRIYKAFFEYLSKIDSVEKILVHGYDYIRTDHAKIVTKDGWVNKYLESKGLSKSADRTIVISYLIDQFNGLLISLAKDFPKVVYINNRNVVNADEWYDEIHPNNEGFEKVAAKFLEEMK